MVTLNMESWKPMGRVYAENRSKTQKPLGFKGLNSVTCKFDWTRLLTYPSIKKKCSTKIARVEKYIQVHVFWS